MMMSGIVVTPPVSRPKWHADAVALLLILAAAIGLMWSHLAGNTLFVGNYDRLGYFLPVRLNQLDSVTTDGVRSAWDDKMFMGFDVADLPGAGSPLSPLWVVTQFASRDTFFFWAGAIVAGLVFLTGAAAYVSLRQFALSPLASLVGAIVYLGSSHSMIRLAQSDTASLVLAALPTGVWLIHGAHPTNRGARILALTAISALVLLNAVGPLTIYTVMLWGLVACIQAWSTRASAPLLVFLGGVACGGLCAVPQLWGVAADLATYGRDGGVGRSFTEIYEFFNVRSHEALRALDDGIFGRYPGEVQRLGNNLNLSEGFQVYSGTFASLCVLTVLLRHRGEWLRLFKLRDGVFSLFAWVLAAVAAVILIKPVAEGMFILFFKANLIHARLSLVGTFASAVLVAHFIDHHWAQAKRLGVSPTVIALAVVSAGVIGLGIQAVSVRSFEPATLNLDRIQHEFPVAIHRLLRSGPDRLAAPAAVTAERTSPRSIRIHWDHQGLPASLFEISMQTGDQDYLRIGETTQRHYEVGDTDSATSYRFTVRARRLNQLSPSSEPALASAYDPARQATTGPQLVAPSVKVLTNRVLAVLVCTAVFGLLLAFRNRTDAWQPWAMTLLLVLVVLQVGWDAYLRWNRLENRTFPVPFSSNNYLTAPSDSLRSSDLETKVELHAQLEPNRFRTIFLAASNHYLHPVAPHLASYWQLRTVEGYLSGVPSRLAGLPWPDGILGFRTLSFGQTESVPWELLGILNVRQAIVVDPQLYFDTQRDGSRALRVIENPSPVLPREFFAPRTIGVDAFSEQTKTNSFAIADVREVARVEGLVGEQTWSTSGSIRADYRGHRINIELDPSNAPRFLVLNELYHPRWFARTGEQRLPVYAANQVMRGVQVPPGTTTVILEFRPYSRFPGWWLFPGAGFTLAILVPWAMGRDRAGSAQTRRNLVKTVVSGIRSRLADPILRRWIVVGAAATALNLGTLYMLVSILRIPFVFAPLVSAELCIVLRFLANDRWVFGNQSPSWRRLGEYHIAVAGGFAAWWVCSNLLVLLGVHYLLASLLAIACSLALNLATNLLWVWRKSQP